MTMLSARMLTVVAAGRQYGDVRRDGGTGTAKSPGRGGDGGDDTDWMQKARKLANKRASQFRRERGAQPVAPAQWRRKRKGEKGDEFGYVEAARGYDDIPKDVADDREDELTATAGDGLWRVDFGDLAEEDWGSQWTMTDDEWKSVEKLAKGTDEPLQALQVFEDAGLRRVNPDISARMLRIIANKAKSARVDREELSGLRRDSRIAHLLGMCVAAARRGSDALSPNSVVSAVWAIGVISTERANSAEMEVLAARAAQVTDDVSKRGIADLAWALASCRHASEELFQQIGIRAAVTGLEGSKPFDISTLVYAFAHLGHSADGFLDGLDQWFAGGAEEEIGKEEADANAAKKAASFTPQPLVTTAWSLAVIGGDALRSRAFSALWSEICVRGEAAAAEGAMVDPSLEGDRIQYGPWRGKNLNQINQAIVAVQSAGGTEALGLRPVPDSLAAAAESAWMAQRRPPVISWYQRDVASILSYMGEKHEEEAVCGGYRVDLLIPNPVGVPELSGGIAIEVDGPSHFARNDTALALGQTRLKHRQLRHLGMAVVSVSVAEWEYLESAEEKVEYLRAGMAGSQQVA